MPVRIITDSTADLPKELIEKYEIGVAPLMVNFQDGTFRDGVDLTPGEFYSKLKRSKQLPTTSQVNPPAFVDLYRRELEEGNSVVSIHLSSKGSGTYQSALSAKNTLGSDDIAVIDSLGYSMGMGLIAVKGAEMAQQGASLEEVRDRMLHMRDRMKYVFGVDTLEYLKKGGRLSPVKAAIATVMNIKPILHILDGEIDVMDKVRGRKKVLVRLLEEVEKTGGNIEEQTLAVVHSECPEEAEKMKDMLKEKVAPKDVLISQIGCVIGTHVGPGTISVFYMS
ncbi:MAG: DegV family protein [Bacillota bacterium]|jgi:DegV family protein with EDD domain|nr:DegV family protein [Bacillota bacterium]MDD3298251.1 DegV family protein [Bacillota bacterium]MDD3851617.1 DegV family protein [Bacillota bacterium]MDD4708136.1 DegV family protein [Bacillota bacterium]